VVIAIRPDVLHQMVRDSITDHIDTDKIVVIQETERQERQLLEDIRCRL